MLVTRCPHCATTFEVTGQALRQAGGQVRCGRCANVFDAYRDLHDAGETDPELSHARTDRELAAAEAATANPTAAIWAHKRNETRAASPRWRIGAAAALVVLALQVVHHFRSELASQDAIGPWLRGAYALIGVTVVPRWDVGQYEILDWVAAAKPSDRERGTLEINARVHNRGPRAQPYPHIQLELKDRWEETVGRRVFRPAEYLDANPGVDATIRAGATVRAQLEVVDPGPDAYGFELDLCVQTEAGELSCGNDAVFSN